MDQADAPVPEEGLLVTHLVVAVDPVKTSAFYADLLGGEIVYRGEVGPTFIKLRTPG